MTHPLMHEDSTIHTATSLTREKLRLVISINRVSKDVLDFILVLSSIMVAVQERMNCRPARFK